MENYVTKEITQELKSDLTEMNDIIYAEIPYEKISKLEK